MERIEIVDSLAGVPAAQWNALAGQQPFVRHEFLSALIETGCASARTGWAPRFVLLRRDGELAGAMPLFAKMHSYGEYVFDWAWADAHERHGISYYPKMLSAIPFTPVRGTRILAADQSARQAVISAALEASREASSLHVLFPTTEEARSLERAGLMLRTSVQFHWQNDGYRDFDEFLSKLTHARRKNIRQERRKVHDAGVRLHRLEGRSIEEGHWEFFHRCYRRTYAAHRSSPYLNLAFFRALGERLPEHLLLVLAERDGRPVGGSLFLKDDDALYGRYWGAAEHVPLLHFECCYYQAIEYAIERGLARFEGGAQGEHKLFRGLMPVETLSAHWIADARFARAVEQFLEREGSGIAQYVNELCEHSPFRRLEGES